MTVRPGVRELRSHRSYVCTGCGYGIRQRAGNPFPFCPMCRRKSWRHERRRNNGS